ncbi:MAG: oxidoreductase, partial [Nocardioides sp.]
METLAVAEQLEGVASAFAATRDGIDTMLRDRGLRRTSSDLTAESLLRGAHASAVLDGSGSSLEEVRAGDGDEIAQASLRVSVELMGLVPVLRRAPA